MHGPHFVDDLPDEVENTVIKNLRAFYPEFQMKQLIRNSTRVTNCSNTLLDHLVTNTPKFIAISGVKTISFSDHDLIYGMHKISSKVQKEPKRIRYRSLKHYNPIRFHEELNMSIRWDKIINLDDLHQCSREWERNFINILDKHAPFKHRKGRNNYATYIDHELRQKMFRRNLYKKKHTKYGDADDWLSYKNLKNEVNVMVKSKRKSYFPQKLHEAKGDSKETWRILNSALGRRSKTTNINSLKADNDNEVTCHKDIANILNTHCDTVSDKVLQESGCRLTLSEFEELRYESSISPLDYLSHIGYEGEPFKFHQITVEDIIRSASTVKNSKSSRQIS